MHETQGLYESVRDIQPIPNCWYATNNYCYPHFHSTVEMVFCYEGEMEVILDGESFLLGAGQLLVVPSYTVHRFFTNEYSQVIILSLPLDYISSFRRLMNRETFSQYILRESEDLEEIEFYFHGLANLCSEDPDHKQPYLMRGYVYALLGLILENIPLTSRAELTEPHQLQNILSYLEDNFLSPLTLDDIAGHFGYSKSRFSHIFNENVGCSITEYLGFLRARRAASLLSVEDANITDVAMDSGFGSTRSFYRTFQKCFGLTPSEYRSLDKKERARVTSRHPVRSEL